MNEDTPHIDEKDKDFDFPVERVEKRDDHYYKDELENPFYRVCCPQGPIRTMFRSAMQWGKNRDFAAKEAERLFHTFPDWK